MSIVVVVTWQSKRVVAVVTWQLKRVVVAVVMMCHDWQ
jgi:hypothetical protein